jgi:hypothetical protein
MKIYSKSQERIQWESLNSFDSPKKDLSIQRVIVLKKRPVPFIPEALRNIGDSLSTYLQALPKPWRD